MNMPALLQLLHIPGIGHKTLNRLFFRIEKQGLTLSGLLELSPEDLVNRFGFRMEWAHAFLRGSQESEELARELEEQQIHVICMGDECYPTRLERILGDAAPPVLFARGNTELLQKDAIAVAGARECSDRGVNATQRYVQKFVEHNYVTVSGNAAGIDTTAHEAALESGGNTIFILAQGILHFKLRPWMTELYQDNNCLVVSEFYPRLPWAAFAAMQRNRTICALARAVFLMESGKTGGTFATGNNALKLKVPLFVMEYDPVPSSAEGNRFFIHKGAYPVREDQDGMDEILGLIGQQDKPLLKEGDLRLFSDL